MITHMGIATHCVVLCIISSSPDPHMCTDMREMSHVGFDLHWTYEGHYFPYIQAAVTQLLSAARNGDIVTVTRLVSEGHVDVNVMDEVGVSSLSYF